MQGIGDLIPSIASYLPVSASLRQVSKEWKYNIDQSVSNAIANLDREYKGSMKDLNGKVYSTLYTKLREAIRSLDMDILIPIISSSGYLPIPWDLLAFDIFVLEKTYKGDISTLLEALQERWTPYGKAAYLILKGGLLSDMNVPAYALSPYVESLGGKWGFERNSTIERLDEFASDPQYRDTPQYEIALMLGLIQYDPYRYKEWVISTFVVGMRDIQSTNMNGNFLRAYLYLYLNMDTHMDQETAIKYMKMLEKNNDLKPDEPSYYPYTPIYLDMETIILFDRQDLLSIYNSDKEMIEDILHTLSSGVSHLGSRVYEYVEYRIKDWDRIIPHIDSSLIKYIQYLPIPLSRMMAYGAYHGNTELLSGIKEEASLEPSQVENLIKLAKKYNKQDILQWIRENYI